MVSLVYERSIRSSIHAVAVVNAKSDRNLTPSEVESPIVLSVDKALLIVELLMRDEEPRSAREIALRLGLNRTTVHRLLNTLIHRGWLEKVPAVALYRLSLKFLVLLQVSGQSRNLVQEIRPALDRLSSISRETVHLGALDGYDVVHIDKVDSPESYGISSRVGSRGVPHLTSLGKALLAAESDAFLDHYLESISKRNTPIQFQDIEAVRSEIRATQARGYSVDNEEDSIGVRCLGVAIHGPDSRPLFAISVTGPSPRFTLERLASCVPYATATARELSLQFGWKPDRASGTMPEIALREEVLTGIGGK